MALIELPVVLADSMEDSDVKVNDWFISDRDGQLHRRNQSNSEVLYY